MPILTQYPINTVADSILDSTKVTAGYFPSGVGTLSGTNIHSGSVSATNEEYYFNIVDAHPLSSSADVVFSVTYGHSDGSGSKIEPNTKGETQAIYGQWAETLLSRNEVSGGFRISAAGTSGIFNGATAEGGAGDADKEIFVLVGKRARFKDRLNKKNWTIVLSGSGGGAPDASAQVSGSGPLSLTDDSNAVSPTATPAGPRYNIVSGSSGTVHTAAATRTYGWFYPNLGVMVFSQAELSGSTVNIGTGIAGSKNGNNITASFSVSASSMAEGTADVTAMTNALSSSGFNTNLTANTVSNPANALRFVQCLRNGELTFRSEEDQTSVSYFCRVRPPEANFSNNITFVSGSVNRLRQSSMWGNPTTYITGIGLMNANGVMVAMGKLSTPLKKNFSSEATIKVKLTY